MSSTPVLVERLGPITRITINRPEARNSLNAEAIRLLTEAFAAVATCVDTRVIVLSGSGTDAFCAGADIAELSTNPSPEARREFFHSIATLIEKIDRCPMPVIAQVYGYALAGGCGLVGAADIALASDEALFGLPEVGIGLAPMVVMAPLMRAIGTRAVSSLALTGTRVSAAQAVQMGLVSQALPKEKLKAAVDDMCAQICAKSPQAIRATKAALADLFESGSLSFMRELADRSALVSLASEAEEGLTAFREKRDPTWKLP
jgi:enoyl-CoA hydratase/carnithine racemase